MKLALNRSVRIPAVVAAGLLLLLMIVNPKALQIILALPLVFFLPGFALSVILFERDRLGIPMRLVLSMGLSLAITALLGLVLNWTQLGLRATTLWPALLLVLALEVGVIVFVRRLKWTDVISIPNALDFHPRQWLLAGLAAGMAFMAFQMARTPASPHGLEGYTTLWIQPTGAPDTVRLGVRSDEFAATEYQIHFELDGATHEGPSLELRPGETWEGLLHLPTHPSAGSPLKISLHRLDQPADVYRYLIWSPQNK